MMNGMARAMNPKPTGSTPKKVRRPEFFSASSTHVASLMVSPFVGDASGQRPSLVESIAVQT
jgi:hypothetical protein